MSAHVYVARHGETTWNLAGRFQGRRETALTALGLRQGIALGDAVAALVPRIEAVIASPLLRCTATARFAADRLNVELTTDERLVEIAHGPWEGRLRADIAVADADRYRAWRTHPAAVRFPDGETLDEVAARWHAFVRDLDTARPTLIVTHDVVVRVAILTAQGRPLDALWEPAVENAAYATFTATPDGMTLIEESATAHLHGLHAATHAQAL